MLNNNIHAIRPQRKQNDEFFDHGNEMCHQTLSDIILSYMIEIKQEEDEESPHNNHIPNEDHDDDYRFSCCVPHCREMFDCITAYEKHYETTHMHECHSCKRVFPNEYLLDLHLQESHDTYYQTLVEHRKISYKCLVQNCLETFACPMERLHHLQRIHGYPKWFRWNPTIRRSSRKYHAPGGRIPKWKHDQQQQQNQWQDRGDVVMNGIENGNKSSTKEEEEDLDKMKMKKQRRSERRKERNKNIPCRYYNSKHPGSCWRGDRCMFLHEKVCDDEHDKIGSTSNNNDHGDGGDDDHDRDSDMDHDSDMDRDSDRDHDIPEEDRPEETKNETETDRMQVDDLLANEMKKNMNISVPVNISFGRRRRR